MPYFKVRDLMINVMDQRLKLKKGGLGLCMMDQPTTDICTIHSPVMQVAKLSDLIRVAVERLARDPASAEQLEEVAAAIGHVVIAGAGGGGTAMPDPNCGGTSYETLPPTVTPVVHSAAVLTPADLPLLKENLRATLAAVEKVETQFAPNQGIESKVVAEHLEGALASLRRG